MSTNEFIYLFIKFRQQHIILNAACSCSKDVKKIHLSIEKQPSGTIYSSKHQGINRPAYKQKHSNKKQDQPKDEEICTNEIPRCVDEIKPWRDRAAPAPLLIQTSHLPTIFTAGKIPATRLIAH